MRNVMWFTNEVVIILSNEDFYNSTLGRDEGFGENIDITTNGKDVNNVVQVEIIDKRSDVETKEGV